jgi:hypothetical protein
MARAMGGKGEHRQTSMVIEVGDFKSLAKLFENKRCKPLKLYKTHKDAVGTMADVLLMRASGMDQRVDVAKEVEEKVRKGNRVKVRWEKREFLERMCEEGREDRSDDTAKTDAVFSSEKGWFGFFTPERYSKAQDSRCFADLSACKFLIVREERQSLPGHVASVYAACVTVG